MSLPFRSTDRKSTLILQILTAVGILSLLSGCPSADSDIIVNESGNSPSSPQSVQKPASLRDIPSRPLPVLLPDPYYWQAPTDPELTPLGDPNRQNLEQSRESQSYWGCLVHKIRPGDTLYKIASKYYRKTNYAQMIRQFNPHAFNEFQNLLTDKFLYLPTRPLIQADGSLRPQPARSDFYITKSGDTWSFVAKNILGSANQISSLKKTNPSLASRPDPLPPGMRITLPASSP